MALYDREARGLGNATTDVAPKSEERRFKSCPAHESPAKRGFQLVATSPRTLPAPMQGSLSSPSPPHSPHTAACSPTRWVTARSNWRRRRSTPHRPAPSPRRNSPIAVMIPAASTPSAIGGARPTSHSPVRTNSSHRIGGTPTPCSPSSPTLYLGALADRLGDGARAKAWRPLVGGRCCVPRSGPDRHAGDRRSTGGAP